MSISEKYEYNSLVKIQPSGQDAARHGIIGHSPGLTVGNFARGAIKTIMQWISPTSVHGVTHHVPGNQPLSILYHHRAGMVSSTLLVFLVGVAIRGVVSQDITTSPNTTETTSATTSPSGSAVSGESADEKSCSYDGSVTDYLKCQKDNVSSGTLIAAGIGVTVGVLAIVGIGVWMCQRKRRTVPKPTTSTKTQPARRTRSKRDEEEAAGYDSEDEYLSDPIPPVPNKSSMNRATDAAREKGQFVTASHRDVRARVDSVSGSETEEIMRKHGGPPPPHPAHQINPSLQRGVPVQPTGQPRQIDPRPAVQLPSQLVGSPVDAESNPRNLYPSNPSPTPRHMRPQPPMTSRPASAMRQSVYSKRQSVVSVRKSPPIGNTAVPPLPPIHALRQDSSPPAGQTRPLLIRKSTLPQGASSLPYNSPPTAKPSEIRPIPSYLEATNAPTPQRRPSEGPKRGSEERGGMI